MIITSNFVIFRNKQLMKDDIIELGLEFGSRIRLAVLSIDQFGPKINDIE